MAKLLRRTVGVGYRETAGNVEGGGGGKVEVMSLLRHVENSQTSVSPSVCQRARARVHGADPALWRVCLCVCVCAFVCVFMCMFRRVCVAIIGINTNVSSREWLLSWYKLSSSIST